MASNQNQAIKFNHKHLLGIQYLSIPEVNLILDESLAFVELNRQENKKLKIL
jgi:aspartate carbamoyltransferase catalytic subunit